MFDESDPLLARVRTIALGFPDATEKISHGRPTFSAPTMFAVYGGSEIGPYGRLGLDFDTAPPDWDEVSELIDASFRMQAPPRLIRRLDG